MKNKLSFRFAVWWVLLCAVMGALLLIASDKQPRESEEENRMLAGFPKLSAQTVADASFMNGMEDYLTDAVFGRSQIKSFVDGVTGTFNTLSEEDLLEKDEDDMAKRLEAELFDGNEELESEMEEEAETISQDEGDAGDAEELIDEEEEEEPDLTLSGDDAMLTPTESYMWLKRTDGTNKVISKYPIENIQTFAGTLGSILDLLPEDGHIYYTQAVLSALARRWTSQPKSYCGWGSTMEEMLQNNVDSDRIHIFSTPNILEKPLSEGEYLFYETDHHWTTKAAYLVAKEMLEMQGLPIVPYDEYEYKVVRSEKKEGKRDTFDVLYPLLPTHSMVVTNVNQEEEIPLMNYSSTTYRTLMNNSRRPWRRIETGVNNDRRALVMCDSFGNAFVPYLLPYYEEVHMVDFRKGYYDKNEAGGSISELMKAHEIDDVYIIISTVCGINKPSSLKYLPKYLFE